MDAMTWIVLQSTKGTTGTSPPERFNPRPPGVIVEGSSSDTVLAFLRSDFKLKTRSEIINGLVNLSEHRVEWALIYLQRRKLIKWCPDPSRNTRYGRYRAVKEGESDDQ